MKIKKAKNSYDDYDVELSFSQLLCIKNALAADHSDPVSDETYASLNWFLQNALPGPGESEEDLKKAEEAGASGLDTETGESPLKPRMPGSGAGNADDLLPAPDEDMGPEGGPGPESEEGGPDLGPEGRAEHGPPEGEENEIDRRIPVPRE